MNPERAIQILGVICLIGVGWVLGYASSQYAWNETAAAWVQAFGSIGAIVAGFVYVQWQAQLTRNKAEVDKKAEMSASRAQILAMAEFCQERISGAYRSTRNPENITRGDVRLFGGHSRADLNTASTFSYPQKHSSRIIITFARFPAILATVDAQLERSLRLLEQPRCEPKKILYEMSQNIEIAHSMIDDCMAELRSALADEAST